MSVVSTVNRQADRLLGRSTWPRYGLGVRILAAAACWALGTGTTIGVFGRFQILGPVAWICVALVATWSAIMLTAYVANSRVLMIVSLWSTLALGIVPIGIGIALAE